MAKKGGKRGSSSARSAAAKKGWETRRRGGAAKATSQASKATKPTAPSRKAPPPPAWSPAMKAAAGRKRTSNRPANAIKPSPRRLNGAEQAYWDITRGKGKSKFRSDKKVREEMQRRGFLSGKDPHGQLIAIAARARKKKGQPY